MKRITFLLFFISVTSLVFAQEKEGGKGRPDVPGILQLDYGFTFPMNGDMPVKGFGTRAINIYYLQSFQFGESKISFHPGVGVGLDKYRFDLDSLNREITIIDTPDSVYYSGISGLNVSKSTFMASYIDIPLEFRYSSNPADITRSFNIAIGGKLGFLLQGKTKYKYKIDTEVHKIKQQHPFDLTRFRYGAYLRVGGGGINAFVNYMITPVFNEEEAPGGQNANTLTAGISINLF